MIRQTIKFAIRSFRKTAFMNWLNITSLTLGLTVFFLISLFLYQESSYEKDFSRRHDIYQVGTHFYNMGDLAWTSTNLEHVMGELSSVEKFTQFNLSSQAKFISEGIEFDELKVISADSSFFEIFDFTFIAGNPSEALDHAGMVVLNEDFALRVFGTLDVVGKTIYTGNKRPFLITGIARTPHYKTQLNFDAVLTKTYSKSLDVNKWSSIGSYTYVRVNPQVTKKGINEQLELLGEKYIYSEFTELNPEISSFDEWKKESSYLGLYAEPLMDLRGRSNTKNLIMPQLNVSQFNVLIIVGIAALLISVINFVNISTAKASVRTAEVGVKRVLGSSRRLLISQFMIEAFFQVALSSVLALALVETIINYSPEFMKGLVGYSVLHSNEWVLGLIAFVAVLSLISGMYPAIYLSSGRSLNWLKSGNAKNGSGALNAALFRKVATVVQFMLSIVLISGLITMFQQLDYLNERDLGYESVNVFILDNTYLLKESNEAFKTELERLSAVQSVTYADHFPNQSDVVVLDYMVKDQEGKEYPFINYRADMAFFEVMQMSFVEGKTFQPRSKSQESEEKILYPIVVNETAVRSMGIKDPIGKVIDENRQIVGVVNDFVFSDLRQGISPVMIGPRDSRPYYKMAVRMAPGNFDISTIEKVWSQFSDQKLKWYEFSSNYENLMSEENKTFSAVLTFSIFTVLISCLGLFGLAVFTVDQRIKEFGIRKVLGASIMDIARLFSWDFLKLILIAFILALPVAIYGLNTWLNDFADKIKLSPLVFLVTSVLTLAVVLLTILFQMLKAGRLNPVETLRNE